MFTIDDLNNVTAYLLELWGPRTPVEIRQFLDHISREARISLLPIDPFAADPERVIEPMIHPPIQVITRLLNEWSQENPGRNFVVHLFVHGDPNTFQNRRSREEWERNHPGQEEVVVHEFRVGNPDSLTEEQRRVVEDILILNCNQDVTNVYSRHGGAPWREKQPFPTKRLFRPTNSETARKPWKRCNGLSPYS